MVTILSLRLRDYLRKFCIERTASVTTTFALATIPLIGAVGAAVDYSHVNSARTAMQSAFDAASVTSRHTAYVGSGNHPAH